MPIDKVKKRLDASLVRRRSGNNVYNAEPMSWIGTPAVMVQRQMVSLRGVGIVSNYALGRANQLLSECKHVYGVRR